MIVLVMILTHIVVAAGGFACGMIYKSKALRKVN